ncbi:hypothetical protein DSO57_1015141 [Entomophthora muscae]|uniref:Uncharacterized protein n=2 Tax=Entomophthora muscae TaxID=34485 RepID=A0ACC2SHL0_9FUNG|nr:hypothetical protein DSO57_1017347 [Entomophthora muscae]KAJ9085330.1 hypothetical protein DSO57_1015141 [Entomophthora muscae]
MQIGNKKTRSKNAIPRPKNSFMVYRQEKQEEIISKNGRINNTLISEIAGYMWRTEDEEVKKAYRDKAEIGKREHRLLYPDYKYTPKKPQKPKSHKQKKIKIDTSRLDLHKNLKADYFDQIIKYIDLNVPEIRGSSIQANICQLPPSFLDTKTSFMVPTQDSVHDHPQQEAVKEEHYSQQWSQESILQLPQFVPLNGNQLLAMQHNAFQQYCIDPQLTIPAFTMDPYLYGLNNYQMPYLDTCFNQGMIHNENISSNELAILYYHNPIFSNSNLQ